jgi:hypothetical protein
MYRKDCSCYTEQHKCRYNVEPQSTALAPSSPSIFGPWLGGGRSYLDTELREVETRIATGEWELPGNDAGDHGHWNSVARSQLEDQIEELEEWAC